MSGGRDMQRWRLWANLALLLAFPVAWSAPLLRAGLLPLFGLTEISVLSGLSSLWGTDKALAALVAFFALAAPYGKVLALAAVQTGRLGRRALPALAWAGRLAMADVFLVALYIVVAKGSGFGRVEAAWGLWLFTGCVLASLALAHSETRAKTVGGASDGSDVGAADTSSGEAADGEAGGPIAGETGGSTNEATGGAAGGRGDPA